MDTTESRETRVYQSLEHTSHFWSPDSLLGRLILSSSQYLSTLKWCLEKLKSAQYHLKVSRALVNLMPLSFLGMLVSIHILNLCSQAMWCYSSATRAAATGSNRQCFLHRRLQRHLHLKSAWNKVGGGFFCFWGSISLCSHCWPWTNRVLRWKVYTIIPDFFFFKTRI